METLFMFCFVPSMSVSGSVLQTVIRIRVTLVSSRGAAELHALSVVPGK